MKRKLHRWDVRLIDEEGRTEEREVRAYWDPDKVSLDEIATAAAAEARVLERRSIVGAVAELAA